jgi:hypothetical protein
VQRAAGLALPDRGADGADDDGVAALVTGHYSSSSLKLGITSCTQVNT